MTTINTNAPVGGASAGQPPSPRAPGKELSKDDFIKIFLAQMRMQSPLKPYDSSAMLQQMSQLTALSATEELQKTIQNLNNNMGKTQALSASQLIGKHVQVPSKLGQLVAGEGLHGSVILPESVTSVEITIKNSKGDVVGVVKKDAPGAGLVDFDWNGKRPDGKDDFPPGIYQISAKATINGKPVDVYTAGAFKVQSVTLNPQTGAVILNLDGLSGKDALANMSDIIKII